MHPTIIKSYGTTSYEAIAQTELRLGIVFPMEYKQFLLSSNGGKPIPDVFDVPGWTHVGGTVNRFLGIHDVYFAKRLPPGIIPIATESCGNLVCLGITGKRRGKIYFWDHEDEFDEHGEGRQDYGNVYLVADSLDKFLDKLYELKDE
jgi:hypothetical protein